MLWSWPCDLSEKVYIRPALKRADYEQAFSLTYAFYRQSRLILPQTEELWFTPFQFLPDSRVLLAASQAQSPSSTGSLVFDSAEFGLPADLVYRERLNKLRRKGRFLAECTAFASKAAGKTAIELLQIFKVFYHYALHQGATDLVWCVRPEEAGFFERVLLFRRLGPLRLFPRYHSGYVVLMHLDLQDLPRVYAQVFNRLSPHQNLYLFLMESPLPLEIQDLTQVQVKREDFIYFFLQRTNMWAKLSEEERAYLAYIYDVFGDWAEVSQDSPRPDLVV